MKKKAKTLGPIYTSDKYRRSLQRAVNKLKVSKKVAAILTNIGVTLFENYVEELDALRTKILMWERLYLDQPEDRLWHAKDQTWWKRLHGQEKLEYEKRYEVYLRKELKIPKRVKIPSVLESNALFKADPPPEIQRLANAAHGVMQKVRRLKGKPHLVELWNALKPFGVIPVAMYVNPQANSEVSDPSYTKKS